eukprot:TRINITY_DN525_c0_g1_i9.p10 TRINITY_DN525_c0_g1~~TRINITY_DN525_c0_g1_i9.p10  ORF type:complete len:104 (-),score=6.93 TRINITY_DN525_c0_g1_i9:1181-1492(-)
MRHLFSEIIWTIYKKQLENYCFNLDVGVILAVKFAKNFCKKETDSEFWGRFNCRYQFFKNSVPLQQEFRIYFKISQELQQLFWQIMYFCKNPNFVQKNLNLGF